MGSSLFFYLYSRPLRTEYRLTLHQGVARTFPYVTLHFREGVRSVTESNHAEISVIREQKRFRGKSYRHNVNIAKAIAGAKPRRK